MEFIGAFGILWIWFIGWAIILYAEASSNHPNWANPFEFNKKGALKCLLWTIFTGPIGFIVCILFTFKNEIKKI